VQGVWRREHHAIRPCRQRIVQRFAARRVRNDDAGFIVRRRIRIDEHADVGESATGNSRHAVPADPSQSNERKPRAVRVRH
jgi:hypothetical protein